MARRTLLVIYIATYLLTTATIVRYVVRFGDYRFWSITLQSGYLILLFSSPFYIRRNRLLSGCYFFVQVVIICALSLISPSVDYWTALFVPLVVQVMHYYTQRTGFLITGLFTAIMVVLMLLGPGPSVGLPLIFINGLGYFLFAAFIAIIREAEASRSEAEVARKEAEASNEEIRRQQLELQSALRQLQTYTTQAEELAVLQERNRLARNLHDSVTQTIFSMRLTTEAANMLLEQNPGRVGAELEKLQSLAKSALAEMRSLIFELRSTAVTALGLVPALRQLVVMLERQYGLKVDLRVNGEPQLTESEAQRLFRISQEALNNVVKHAQTDKAVLSIRFDNGRVLLQVEDQGIGFAPEDIRAEEGHMGLSGMQERVDAMGGTMTVDSHPDQGTRVTVEVTLMAEEKNKSLSPDV